MTNATQVERSLSSKFRNILPQVLEGDDLCGPRGEHLLAVAPAMIRTARGDALPRHALVVNPVLPTVDSDVLAGSSIFRWIWISRTGVSATGRCQSFCGPNNEGAGCVEAAGGQGTGGRIAHGLTLAAGSRPARAHNETHEKTTRQRRGTPWTGWYSVLFSR